MSLTKSIKTTLLQDKNSMNKAIIFDIKEFGLHDGNGMRTTVFFKGCPLKCVWCHNPESQDFKRELIRNLNKCMGCGLCKKVCSHTACQGFSACVKVCPNNSVRIVGEEIDTEELSKRLLKNKQFLEKGGVTFSGGEPLCYGEFILELIPKLEGLKTAVETCGEVPSDLFRKVTEKIDDIFMDIKIFNEENHIRYTGKSNKQILKNAEFLLNGDRFVTFRIPLIPTITDTDENLSAIAEFLSKGKEHILVELIPYNRMTGAKYKNVGREYSPEFDENAPLNKNVEIFTKRGIKCVAY